MSWTGSRSGAEWLICKDRGVLCKADTAERGREGRGGGYDVGTGRGDFMVSSNVDAMGIDDLGRVLCKR